MYIGSSKNIENRIKKHKKELKDNTHVNFKFQIDFNKDNNAFDYTVIEEVDNPNQLKEREGYYIKLFDSINKGYNMMNSTELKVSSKDQLDKLMIDYFRDVKNYKVPIKIPYICKQGTVRQTNLKIKIFVVLNELHNVLDNYFLPKLNKFIVQDSLVCELDIDAFKIDGIEIHITYKPKDILGKDTVFFYISDIYKIIKEKNISMEEAIIRLSKDKKHFGKW